MAIFKCKQEYSFTIEAATDKEATTLLEGFHQEEDKILYGSGSRVKADRSTAFSMPRRALPLAPWNTVLRQPVEECRWLQRLPTTSVMVRRDQVSEFERHRGSTSALQVPRSSPQRRVAPTLPLIKQRHPGKGIGCFAMVATLAHAYKARCATRAFAFPGQPG